MKKTDLKRLTCNLRPDVRVLLLTIRGQIGLIRLSKFYLPGTYEVASILIKICRRSSQEYDCRK